MQRARPCGRARESEIFMPELELIIDGNLSWGDYKQIVSETTPFEVRVGLIEKYVRVNDGANTINDVPVRRVLTALKKILTDVNDPNA